ncbi:MAG: outer membrane lipoprotein carrier protein LolA, partial [Burkholderiales bacterium]|nr:outer membrane lipoprotein carrier protein LolA [Burkholderiales bacterium]
MLSLLTAAPARAAFDLDALTHLLAQRHSAQARFTEERFVSGLDGPLRASGTLSFTAPDHFTRRTLEPQAESMSVDGNTVTLTRGGRTRRMALDAVPQLTALMEAVRATLSGDGAALRRHFKARVEGNPGLWTLTLTPRRTELGEQVRELTIAGQGSELRSIELWLAGGDHSLMLLTPVPAVASEASAASAGAAAAADPVATAGPATPG